MSKTDPTYIALGKRLKFARETKHQSLAEVSGAVEIDEALLERIEQGLERPDEDVLLLLIQYFEIQDIEALRIWEMGNYGTAVPDSLKPDIDLGSTNKVIMLLPPDARTVYSDGLDVMVNNAGMTLDFTQTTGPNQKISVAKIGMGLEQAQAVVEVIQRVLLQAKHPMSPRQLPPNLDK